MASAYPTIVLTGVAISCATSARNRRRSRSSCSSRSAIPSMAAPRWESASGPEAPIRADRSPAAIRSETAMARASGSRTDRVIRLDTARAAAIRSATTPMPPTSAAVEALDSDDAWSTSVTCPPGNRACTVTSTARASSGGPANTRRPCRITINWSEGSTRCMTANCARPAPWAASCAASSATVCALARSSLAWCERSIPPAVTYESRMPTAPVPSIAASSHTRRLARRPITPPAGTRRRAGR
jgi:hypothetical protein